MAYQWKVGEPCIKTSHLKIPDSHKMKYGTITYVVELRDSCPYNESLYGWPIRVFGEPYNDHEWSVGNAFRPLNPKDYDRLRAKHGQPVEQQV